MALLCHKQDCKVIKIRRFYKCNNTAAALRNVIHIIGELFSFIDIQFYISASVNDCFVD